MLVKIALSSLSDCLDLALLPFKTVFRKPVAWVEARPSRKVGTAEAISELADERTVCAGDRAACEPAAMALIQEKRLLVLEGYSIEEVVALCSKHNYRWRIDHSTKSAKGLRFVLEPGKAFASGQEESPRQPKRPPGGD